MQSYEELAALMGPEPDCALASPAEEGQASTMEDLATNLEFLPELYAAWEDRKREIYYLF